jgi:hypothetical protein
MTDHRPSETEFLTYHEPPSDDELVMFLERDQLVVDKERRVPLAQLGARARAALWALRLFVLIVSAMVIYTFFATLGS